MFRIRRPSVQKRVRRDILINPDLVSKRVVLVVFVRPPRDPQSRTRRRQLPESVAPLVFPVYVVVSEPSGLGEEKTE